MRKLHLSCLMLACWPGVLLAKTHSGLVVEDSAGEIVKGDVIKSWVKETKNNPAEENYFDSPFDLYDVSVREGTGGTTTLKVQRGEEEISVEVSVDQKMVTRPRFEGENLERYETGKAFLKRNEFKKGIQEFQILADCLFNEEEIFAGAWVLAEMSRNQARAHAWTDIEKTLQQADEPLAKDKRIKAQLMEAAANIFEEHHRYRDARRYFEKAAGLRQDIEDRWLQSHNMERLGHLYYLPGDMDLAADYFRGALDIHGRHIGQDSSALAQLLNNMGKVALAAGNHSEAEGYFRRAHDTAARIDPSGIIYSETLQSLAMLASTHGQRAHARNYMEQAQAVMEQAQSVAKTKDPTNQANTFRGMGETALSEGYLEQAYKHFQRAEALIASIQGSSLEHAELLFQLGILAQKRDMQPQAMEHLWGALDITEEKDANTPLHAEVLHALGNSLSSQSQLQEAVVHYERAFAITEALSRTSQEKQKSSAKLRSYYRDHISALVSLGRHGDAFDLSEKFRARTMLDAMYLRQSHERDQKARELEQLQAKIEKARAAQNQSRMSSFRLRSLKEQARRLSVEIETMRSKFQYEPLDHDRAANLMSKDTALLSYLVLQDRIFLFTLTAEGSHTTTIPTRQLQQDVSYMRRYMMSPSSPTARKKLDQLSRKLGRILFHPAADVVGAYKQLIILPDGPLHGLPFSALFNPAKAQTYMAETHVLTIADSTTTYHLLNQQPTLAAIEKFRWMGFGAPQIAQNRSLHRYQKNLTDYEHYLETSSMRGPHLKPLPYSALELDEIANMFPTEAHVLRGKNASESLVRELASEATVLHFACHGIFNEIDPSASALILAAEAGSTDPEKDGRLTAREINLLDLHANLVVLSSCESGIGKDQAGEGTMSLARAFRFAGARTVLASLWSVSDLSTTMLMKKFYDQLLDQHNTSLALAKAQRAMISTKNSRRDVSHPYYWAAFQLVGTDHQRSQHMAQGQQGNQLSNQG